MPRSRAARRAFDASVSARQRRLARRRAADVELPPGVPPKRRRLFRPSRRALASSTEVDGIAVPDLLGSVARLSLDVPEVVAALDFAFAGGSSTELLAGAFDETQLPDSSFDPACFGHDLFVDELVEETMRFDIEGWEPEIDTAFITRVLSHPPRAEEDVVFRVGVLRELAEGEDEAKLRGARELYRLASELWRLLGEAASTSRYEATRRRIDVLSLLRRIVDHALASFGDATSGLSRIADYAEAVRTSEGYARVVEVLDYENDMARVDVRMQVGVDGRVRRFQILALAERDENRFYATPFGRWYGKLMMWWRGYRFSNDELVDRWLDQVFEGICRFLPSLLLLTRHLEVYLAVVAMRDACRARGLDTCFPDLVDTPSRRIEGLFNPLLFAQGVVPTPTDLTTDDAGRISIITGPNSGGKTRLLQAIGLAQLLAQSGFYAPMRAGELPRASGLFVSVIAEQGADDREGRLGSELIRVRHLFERARGGALVILDERCSGTNPSEGEEIFFLVLQLLAELGPEAFITTHFLTFARRLHDGVEESVDALPLGFLQVELDEHQRPTYGFVPGVATTSLAAQTAARLGVTREELMALVRRNKRG